MLEKYNGKCVVCDSANRVDVHHKTYKNIGNEKDEDLVVLCRNCHAKFHGKPEKLC